MVALLSIVDSVESSNRGKIKSNQISSLCNRSDGSTMVVRVTGTVKAEAVIHERSLDIVTGNWVVDVPEYHWEAAVLLAAGNIWYMGSLLFG